MPEVDLRVCHMSRPNGEVTLCGLVNAEVGKLKESLALRRGSVSCPTCLAAMEGC